MGILLQDLRFALRKLRKSPSFALATVLTIAVAIGANTVALGVFDALILRPLNVPHADSLYEIERVNHENESYASFVDLRDRNRSFDGLAAVMFSQEGLDTGDGASRVWTWAVPTSLDLSNSRFGVVTSATGNRTGQASLRFVF